jgi:hypothetical protein
MTHIFISYSHKDLEYVEKLNKALEDRGFQTWYDYRIRTSTRWFRELHKAIMESCAMIVVMSSHAEQSEYIEQEIQLAKKYDIPIYPLLLEGEGLAFLITRQYYKVIDGKIPEEKFFDELPRTPIKLQSIDTADMSPSDRPEYEIDYAKYVSNKVVKYDDASWHVEGGFPEGISEEQGFIHIGMYLGWLIDHNLLSEEVMEEFSSEIDGFKERKISGTQILKMLDGKLVSDELNAEGNAFSQDYYEKYTEDFGMLTQSAKMSSDYSVKDTWDNYEIIKNMIDKKYIGWKAMIEETLADESAENRKKAWWKFWQ